MAHRGFVGSGAPENSLPAFGAAVELGFRYVETDVHATADGQLIAFHDDQLGRVTDRSGTVVDLPWRTVREAKIAGIAEIPTLDAVFESWPQLRVNIDCKAESAVEPLVAAIERHRAHDRVCVASFSDKRRLAVVRRLSQPVATSGGRSVIGRFVVGGVAPPWARMPLGLNALRDVDCLQVPPTSGRIRVVTSASLRRAHRAGVQVHVWTIDAAEQMHHLLDLGVDGIMTDRADTLRDVLINRGQWVS